MRGQVTFEVLILALLVISSSVFISGLYIQTSDHTIATSIARTDLLRQINGIDEQVTINSVIVKGVDTATIEVTTDPELTITDFDQASLLRTETKIIEATRFTSVQFNFN